MEFERMEEGLLKEKEKIWKPKETGFTTHHPSSITKCTRARYYAMSGTPITNPVPLDGECKMEVGTAIHDWFVDRLKQQGILIDSEVRVFNTEFNISGRIDAVVYHDCDVLPVEIKTKASFPFRSMRRTACVDCGKILKKFDGGYKCPICGDGVATEVVTSPGLKEQPEYSDYIQLQCYMMMQDFEAGIIVYINRENVAIFEHMVFRDEEAFEYIKERIRLLEEYWEKKELPPREKTPGYDWNCDYCRYRDRCEKDGEDEKTRGDYLEFEKDGDK